MTATDSPLPAQVPGDVEPKYVPIRPHAKQYQLFEILRDSEIKRLYAKLGRRWGKTFIAAFGVVDYGLKNPWSPKYLLHGLKKQTRIALCGPDYRRGRRLWDEINETFADAIQSKREDEMRITLNGGAIIEVYSGEHIGSIRGGGYDLVVIDEAFAFSQYAIDNDVKAATMDRSGRIWFISTPKGGKKNWFCAKYIEATKAIEKGDQSAGRTAVFEGPSWENPFIDAADIEEMRQDTDDLTFREEVGAEILDQSNNILDPGKIRNVSAKNVPDNCFTSVICDFAFGKPKAEDLDPDTKQRKDNTCIHVVSQDNLGFVYSRDGLYDPSIGMEEAYESIVAFVKQYDARQVIVEHVSQDWFTPSWKMWARNLQNVPRFGFVRPTRTGGWEANSIRAFSMILNRGRFCMVEGNPLRDPCLDEMENYTEVKAKFNKCKTDFLVTSADVLQEGVWQGRREEDTRSGRRSLPPHFQTPEERDSDNHRPYSSRYSLV